MAELTAGKSISRPGTGIILDISRLSLIPGYFREEQKFPPVPARPQFHDCPPATRTALARQCSPIPGSMPDGRLAAHPVPAGAFT
jgi:hypothetical protein